MGEALRVSDRERGYLRPQVVPSQDFTVSLAPPQSLYPAGCVARLERRGRSVTDSLAALVTARVPASISTPGNWLLEGA